LSLPSCSSEAAPAVFPPNSPRAEISVADPPPLAAEYDDAGDRLLLRLSDRMLPFMSVNRDDEAAVDLTGVTCLGALLYALDRRSAFSSDDNA